MIVLKVYILFDLAIQFQEFTIMEKQTGKDAWPMIVTAAF